MNKKTFYFICVPLIQLCTFSRHKSTGCNHLFLRFSSTSSMIVDQKLLLPLALIIETVDDFTLTTDIAKATIRLRVKIRQFLCQERLC